MRRSLALSALLLICSVSAATGQLPAGVDSSLHAIFGGRGGGGAGGVRFGPAKWSTNGDAYTTLEGSRAGADIVEYDAATGARTVKVTSAQLTPSGANAPLDIDDYSWSPKGDRLLVFTNSQKVWRQNTRGDYWVLELPSGRLHQVAKGAHESSLMFAKFSPNGSSVAYVRAGDLYVEPSAGGAAKRLTKDATHTLVNGMTDWVYEEEFDLRDGFRWSPDSKSIAFWQFDMKGIRDFLLINDTDSLYPFTTPVQYPKAGTTNSAVRLGVLRADGAGATKWVTLPGDPRQHYLPRAEWVGNDEVVLQYMDRLQQHDWVDVVNTNTGAVRTMLEERDSAWVDVVDDIHWWNGGKEFFWTSERDGWRHLYLAPRAGGAPRLLTRGNYDAMSIEGIDEKSGTVFFSASPENATQQYLYRVSARDEGAAVRLTPADEAGTHNYDVSPNGRWAIHAWSNVNRPPTTELVSLPDHRVIRQLGRSGAARQAGAPTEFFQVTVPGGATLDGWMIKPPSFDASKKYPVLVYVYGEPAAQTVVDRWGGAQEAWHRMLAQQGYVVMSVDTRGTPAPKGRAWRKVIYGAVGPLAAQEEADAVRALTRSRPYLDSSRVAVWGWSGGGSGTLNAMFRHPDVYAVGMSVAPVADQRLYDTIYQERYMGLPQDNPKGYEDGSPISFAEGLRGKLLVVHGSGDDNVHYQGTERLVNRLVQLGKQFDVMVYPNRSHCICEGQGTTLHIYSLLTRYLLTNLAAGGR